MIRPATEADRDAIVALHLVSWQASYGIELPEPVLRDVLPGYLAEKWATRAFRNGQVTLVAEADGIIGFACALTGRTPASPTDEPPLRTDRLPLIDNLHVHPELRGGGWGGRLLTAMNAALAEAGFDRSTLTVLARNQGARRFYAARGGVDRGEEDDILVGHPVRVRRIVFALDGGSGGLRPVQPTRHPRA
ncbi:MAG: GNAT family N-acetyltransferase [Pseudomonadota bacterium]